MARPMKNGLDYFPFDVGFFTDRKIKRLRAAYGADGVSVYLYLLCDIYRSGFYTVYDEDLLLDISGELGITTNLAAQIINYLFSRSLLTMIESKLAEPVKIITAGSIQRRYQAAKKGAKRDIEVNGEFWVLSDDETESFIKLRPEKGVSADNTGLSRNNSDKAGNNCIKESKEKESKAEEIKEKHSVPAAAPCSEELDKLVYDYGEEAVQRCITKVRCWYAGKGREPDDLYGTVRKWLEKDDTALIDHSVDKYMILMNKFDL